MHILAVTNAYPTSFMPGDSPCIRDQLVALEDLGVEVDLVHIDRQRKANYARAALTVLARAISERRYDLVHAYYGHCGALARVQWQHPLVVTFRGSDLLSRREGWMGRWVARAADAVIVMSEEMRVASGREDAHVIPFGVNAAVFRPQPREAARRALGLPQDRRLVLFPWDPARPVKRYGAAQEALRIVQGTGCPADLVVIADRPQEEVATYMNACDALVLPSRHEGSPVAVREALACRLPVVATDVGDVRCLLDGVAGCHIVGPAPEEIALGLSQVLQSPARLDVHPAGSLDAVRSAMEVLGVYREALHRAAKGAGVSSGNSATPSGEV